jgi:hypothetical protein
MITRGQFILSQTVAPVLQKHAYMPALKWIKESPLWMKAIMATAAAPSAAKGIELITPDYPGGPKKTDQEIAELDAPRQPVNEAEHVEVPPPTSVADMPGANQPDATSIPPEDAASVYQIPEPKSAGYQLLRHADATAQLLNAFK